VAIILADFHFRSQTDFQFSYLNANHAQKLQSIKFFIIAGASHHQIGNTNTNSSAHSIFSWIFFVVSSFQHSFISSNLKKSCFKSVLYKSKISILSHFCLDKSATFSPILCVKARELGLAVIINLFIFYLLIVKVK